MLILRLILFTNFVITQNANSAKILGIFPIPGRSHHILGSSLMRSLADKGHDVTIISPFSDENHGLTNGSYKEIFLADIYEKRKEMHQKLNLFDFTKGSKFFYTYFMHSMGAALTESILNHTNVQRLLKSQEHFDVVILEQSRNDALKGIANHFNAPLILLSSLDANKWISSFVGNLLPVSYIPDPLLSYSSKMTFLQRMQNSIFYVFTCLFDHLITYPKQQKLLQKYVSNSLDLYDSLYNVSLILMNSHLSVNQPIPYVPCMVDIGGYHIKPPKKLPQDLQDYLDQAKDGVIYFSMGSILKSRSLPEEKRNVLLKVFSKLKQKVLWKWEDDNLPGQPSNVKISKWLPQQDILAHPNVKLFISHGGLLSTSETVYHGVPVLIIPIYGDQKLNGAAVVNNGYGLSLSFDDITEDNLSAHLNELLNNPKYRDNAKKRSQLSHDRPLKPLDNAIYWIEYVIRHKGAPHLRVAALDLPWYKYFLLDVIILIAAVVLVSIVVIYSIFKRFLLSSQKNTKLKVN